MKGLEPWQLRVVDEARDLKVKLTALRKFFDTGLFQALHVDEQSMMHDQHEAMLRYLRALHARIGSWQTASL